MRQGRPPLPLLSCVLMSSPPLNKKPDSSLTKRRLGKGGPSLIAIVTHDPRNGKLCRRPRPNEAGEGEGAAGTGKSAVVTAV